MSTKIRFDAKSIKFRLWMYFVALGLGVVILIWFLQIFFLNNYYEHMKIAEVNRISASICHAYEKQDSNLTEYIQSLSVSNDYYVMMESNGQVLLFMPESDSILPVYRYKDHLPQLKQLLQAEKSGNAVSFKINTGFEKYRTLAYACYLQKTKGSEIYLYIFSPLYPVGSTVEILKNQLFYVTLITLCAAFVLALYFSGRISKPIKTITKTAKEMGRGDYDVKFTGDSYSEINNLAAALNTAAYELGNADARQKDLIANVSHDLKTPLTMIRSYAEMIRDLSGDNPEKRNAHLQVIIDESERMSHLVSDMASVSAMQMKKIVLEKEVFDLSAVSASLLASYDIFQEQEGYDFVFNAPKDCMVFADKNRITQVIANLTTNAIKYCGEDKYIALNIRKVGKRYRLEVSDHGPGIKPEEISHVWERYYKTSANYVRETKGTGLGLSIVKEILLLHNANFGVGSKVGHGSTFWFELDMVKKEREKPQKTSPQQQEHKQNKQ